MRRLALASEEVGTAPEMSGSARACGNAPLSGSDADMAEVIMSSHDETTRIESNEE